VNTPIWIVLSAALIGATVLLASASAADDVADNASRISELQAPREVCFGENAVFTAKLAGDATGQVRFALKTYAGETVWQRACAARDGTASVVLQSTDAAKLEKGSRVLMVTVGDDAGGSAYAAVRLRGRVFRNVIRAPADVQPGDEIVITDMDLLRPVDAITDASMKGKWWKRRYSLPGSGENPYLVCVEERDLDEPRSCLAPQLTLPLELDGWYEVWVRTYRHREGGGIDVRLSGEKCFLHADPLQINSVKGQPHSPYGALVDVFYRAADMSDQSLVFQQPFGTYDSPKKLCNASLAGVRLVKLSDAQVASIKAERARKDVKIIGYDNDGFSYFHCLAEHDPVCIARLLEPLRDQSAAFFNYELGGLGGIFIPTPYTGMYQMTGHDRDGDLRANAFYRWCFQNDVNIVKVLAERAHELGVKLFVSLMAERCFSPDKTVLLHPEWKVKRGRGQWDYALPEVQDYQVKKIAWIAQNHDIDGFIIDFTRYGHFFNADEPKKFQHMNAFLRKLRKAFDEINAKKKRKVMLCASFGDRSWHLTHWGTGKLDDQGLDVETWLREGIFDMVMPEGPTALDFVAMARECKSRTEVWPRTVCMVSFKEHGKLNGALGPKQIEEGVKWMLDQGAPGIFFFNYQTWTTLRRLGFREELDLRVKVDEVYGLREGPVVEFSSWYPNIEQRNAQRETLKPLTVPSEIDQAIDAKVTVPVRNTFSHPVTARIGWPPPDAGKANPLTASPEHATVLLPPGGAGSVSFHLKGWPAKSAEMPRASVEFVAEDQVVLRHRLPLRAVPRIVCWRAASPPTVDGKLDDKTWADARGMKSQRFFSVGQDDAFPGNFKLAAAYDDEAVYLALDFSGSVSHLKKEEHEHDAKAIYKTDHVEFLIDPAGFEQEYYALAVTASGARAERRAYYYPFAGHFMFKDWDCDWATAASVRADGFSIEASVPLKALRANPRPGDVWRANFVFNYRMGKKGAVRGSWSSSEATHHLRRHLGTLFGTLAFE